MNFRNILAVLMLSLFSLGVAQAAGSPMNEDFTTLLGIADKMIAAGKQADSTTFTTLASEGVDVAKDQGNKGLSITLQRVMGKFKQAKKMVSKGGDFEGAVKLVEEAVVEMKKPPVKPNFGGGSE